MMKDMTEDKRSARRPHTILLENRARAVLTGIQEVSSFNEQEVVLLTDDGDITLLGEGLHIGQLNLEDGKLSLEGQIVSVEYRDTPQQRKGGVFSRIFR